MTLYIVNPETIDILRRALAKHDVSEIKRWPGTEIDPKTEEGLAILGEFAPLFDASIYPFIHAYTYNTFFIFDRLRKWARSGLLPCATQDSTGKG